MGNSHCVACAGCSYSKVVVRGLVVRAEGDLQATRVASDRRSTEEQVPWCFSPRSDVLCSRIGLSIPQMLGFV